jgi:hypothetical protein
MNKKIIKIIEVESCYECPYYEVSGECKLLKDYKKKPLLGISIDCPLTSGEEYVRKGVIRNLEKVWGKSGDEDELEKTMA